jgi:hypothetical protein
VSQTDSASNQHGAVESDNNPGEFTVVHGTWLRLARDPRERLEMNMRVTKQATTELDASMISAIINLVCPECGGGMRGFCCHGKCRRNWRSEWESAMRSETKPAATDQ